MNGNYMVYTVQFDLFVDSDEIIEDSKVEEFLTEQLSSASIDISNCKVIDVND